MVYIVGGYDGNTIFDDIWRLDLLTLQWIKLRVFLPKPVYFHASTLTKDGQLIIFGGVDNIEENRRTDKVFSVWLEPPSLRAMCMEAVQHYIPNLSTMWPDRIRELRIPEDWFESLKRSNVKYHIKFQSNNTENFFFFIALSQSFVKFI